MGILGLWTILAGCSGSTTALNKQPVDQDAGGNATGNGGSVGNGGSGQTTGGAGGATDLDAAAGGGNIVTGGNGGTGNVTGSGGADPFGTGGAPTGATTSKKLDLLIMVDNSSSMADKQNGLARTMADLASRLSAVEDLHVGVITSSLGST
jgi:hypothetical protein